MKRPNQILVGIAASSAVLISTALAWPDSSAESAETPLSSSPSMFSVILPELANWQAHCVVNPGAVLPDGTVGVVQLFGAASDAGTGLIETHFGQVSGLSGEDEVTGALFMELSGISIAVMPSNGPNWANVTSDEDIVVEIQSVSAR